MTYVVADPCVDVLDASCVTECPVDCIYTGGRMAYIHPDECVDCGACEQVCPVGAIYYEEDLPAEFGSYTQVNIDFFATAGSPGGASSVPPGSLSDPEPVARLPRRSVDLPAGDAP